jgi:mRNA interferase MazF
VSFDASIAGEIRKTRPAIIMSNDAANAALNRVIVVPITSQISKVYPGEAMITVNGEQRKAMADQIVTASKHRLSNKLGILNRSDMSAVEDALLFQLSIRR